MARWKLIVLTGLALLPVWYFGGVGSKWGAGSTALFAILLSLTPRGVTHRKWFAVVTVAIGLIVLPSVSALASGRLDLLPFAIGLSAVMGIGIYLFARPWPS